ncbi:MAG: ABC transporter ATP-binding protein [Planctomycetaceae bacterium]|nr:ABC transporter ATP-binding protein [Planctomycetaceae bacterium]
MSVAVQIEHLSKEYKLGVVSYGTLQQDMQSRWARFWGKEDPNSILQPHLSDKTDGTVLQSTESRKNSILALNDVSLTIPEGETLGILGANGAGKSTLLKILSRITAPTTGRVIIKNRIASLLEVGTGFHHEMTGRQNVYLNGAILGMRRSEINRKFDAIVEFSGVGDFLDTPVKRYSSGMYVRLAFSIAAHLDAEILIIDEVLAVGDSAFQQKCTEKMRQLASDEGRTVLFVSHNLESVRRLCRRIIILSQGKMVLDSSDTEEALRQYENMIFV